MSEYERQDPGLSYEPSDRGDNLDIDKADRSPEEIEREIERTRDRMSRNIDELGDRLSPQNLKEEAKSAIKEAAHGAVSNVGEQARRTGNRLVDVIRENPLPVIAVGAGVTWLLTQRSRGDVSGDRMARYAYTGPERRQGESWSQGGRWRQGENWQEGDNWQQGSGARGRVGGAVNSVKDSVSEATSGVSERASELADNFGEFKDRAQERMGELGERARWQTRRVKTNLEHAMEENPMTVAVGAAILGLAIGLLLPETERENQLMGSTRDQLVDRAERTAERVKDAATEAGREVTEKVKAEIQSPQMKDAVRQAGETVKETVKDSARRVKNEAKDAATDVKDAASQENEDVTQGRTTTAKRSGNNPRSAS
jgi:ElaB/YqjD/DUF883 family membrane-anchored ribosome-binding protein